MEKSPILALVVPCYNEEDVLPISSQVFLGKLLHLIDAGRVSAESYVLFVNDGSSDGTWNIISDLAVNNKGKVRGISLSRNRGHQNALLAGLLESKDSADVVVSIDSDCQDDINAIDAMIEKYGEGAQIVYGVRNRRDTDTWFKRTTALAFYRVMRWLGADIVYNHADYRLVSSRVLGEFAHFGEVNLFLRGLFPLVGFKSECVFYDRKERTAGESHYPFCKMLGFAIDGITSLSVRPVRFITIVGGVMMMCGLIGCICLAVCQAWHCCANGAWWMASVGSVFCGIQCVALGIVGEYVGKIYMEAKHRPRYVIADRI